MSMAPPKGIMDLLHSELLQQPLSNNSLMSTAPVPRVEQMSQHIPRVLDFMRQMHMPPISLASGSLLLIVQLASIILGCIIDT